MSEYEVYASDGKLVMCAPASCRYPPRVELDLLEYGYIIKLNGKRLTKSEVRKELGRK